RHDYPLERLLFTFAVSATSMNGFTVREFIALKGALKCDVIGVRVTNSASANSLHQPSVTAPMRGKIAHRMVGRIVNGAMLAFAVRLGVDEKVLARAGRIFFHHARCSQSWKL